MSGRICGRIFDKGPDERNARFVLLAIGEYADKSGACFPYIQSIAKRTLFTREYVGRTVEQLLKDGWIFKTPHPSNHRSFGYQVNMVKLGLCEPSSSEHDSSEDSSCEVEDGSHVNSDDSSCEQSSKPPHPLIGVTVINRQEEPLLLSLSPFALTPQETQYSAEEQNEFIYQAYPRKVGKEAAIRKIKKAVERLVKGNGTMPPMDEYAARRFLCKKTMEYARSPSGGEPLGEKDYRPHPSTWFNQGRYFDEIKAWQKTNGEKNATVSNGTGNKIVGVLKNSLGYPECEDSPWEDGDLPPDDETGRSDTGTVHAGSSQPRLASVSSGDEEYREF
jgi:hypothetical protein